MEEPYKGDHNKLNTDAWTNESYKLRKQTFNMNTQTLAFTPKPSKVKATVLRETDRTRLWERLTTERAERTGQK